jgi:hypothetical protein
MNQNSLRYQPASSPSPLGQNIFVQLKTQNREGGKTQYIRYIYQGIKNPYSQNFRTIASHRKQIIRCPGRENKESSISP